MCLLIHICVNKHIQLFLGEKKKEILSNESCHVASSDISIPTAHSLTNLCGMAPLQLLARRKMFTKANYSIVKLAFLQSLCKERILQDKGSKEEPGFSPSLTCSRNSTFPWILEDLADSWPV